MVPRINVAGSGAFELLFRIELNDEYQFVLEQIFDAAQGASVSGSYDSISQTLELDQIELESGEVYAATLGLVSQSPEIVFNLKEVELVYRTLPARPGIRPLTTSGIPHTQIGVEPVEAVNSELFRRVYSLPEVEQQVAVSSLPGSWGLWLSDNINVVQPDAVIGGREFAHIHPDGSLHAALEFERANDAVHAQWAVMHPWAGDSLWEGFVLLYTPQSTEELDSIFQLIVDSYNFVTGQNIQAADYP